MITEIQICDDSTCEPKIKIYVYYRNSNMWFFQLPKIKTSVCSRDSNL